MTRMPAAERRGAVVCVACAEFARGGYNATTVTEIADRAGVSQPYLFKLFATKRDLFLAAAEYCFRCWEELFTTAAAGLAGQRALEAMTDACFAADVRGELLAFPLKLYAAGHDPRIAEAARRHVGQLHRAIVLAAGFDDARTNRLLASVLLLQTTSALYPCDPAVSRAVSGLSLPSEAVGSDSGGAALFQKYQ
jgi:AcrR family transcriptional regulator